MTKLTLDEKVDFLIESGIRNLNKACALEKKPVDMGHGVLLYPSEFHVIETVGKNPEENLTSIAYRIGVTKGAISRMVKKLEKKGLVKKVRIPGNKKDIVLELTDFGKEAFEWHRAFHQSMETGISRELEKTMTTFSGIAETSYFIRPEYTGKGIGSIMPEYLLSGTRGKGLHCILAGISSLNERSILFHSQHCFSECGRFREVEKRKGNSLI